MPALITHHLFGEKAAKALPSSIFPNREHRLAFLLGNQGPDPFFFRFFGLPKSIESSQELASRMHNESIAKAFQVLRDAVLALPKEDQSLGRAFALGMLSHYALDRVAHPYVYGLQNEIIEQNVDAMADASSQVHAVIESQLDSWMLRRFRNKTVKECPPYKELETTDRINRVAGALLSQVAWEVFAIDLGADEYAQAVKNMTFVYKHIEPAGSLSGSALGLLEEKARGNYSMLSSLSHEIVGSGDTPLANVDRKPWTNPWNHRKERDSFLDRFNEALGNYPQLAKAFIAGGSKLSRAVNNLNYEGQADKHV